LLRTVKSELTPDKVKSFNKMLEDLVGTRGAYILDSKMSILGKVPLSELASTIKSLQTRIHAIVLDGVVDSALIQGIERLDIDYIVAMDSKVKSSDVRAKILTANDL